MIGYRISKAELEQSIEAEKSDWLKNAAERMEEFRKKGRYEEKTSIWSEVKVVYMRLQGDCKCAYCERKLESETYGKGEQDVEHFRPKKSVKAWKIPPPLKKQGIQGSDVPNEGGGYYLLPYHPFNYCASCNPCNRALKKDYFPIAGKYNLKGKDPQKMQTEKPYLIYPIGDFDDAPEQLIHFYGASPQAVADKGHKRARALVTIEFFKLDDDKRKNLFRERATIINALYPQLQKAHGGGSAAEKAAAQSVVDLYISPKAPHTNCARSFRDLFRQNPQEAQTVYEKAFAFLKSIS
jgi:hypothetical protein